MTARELAGDRYYAAKAVWEAYGEQVVKRRRKWLRAPDGLEANRARRALSEAVEQCQKAKDDMDAARRAWCALG